MAVNALMAVKALMVAKSFNGG